MHGDVWGSLVNGVRCSVFEVDSRYKKLGCL